MFWCFNSSLKISWFSKKKNCFSFVTKLHRILLNSRKSVRTLRPKQKWKKKEFWKKKNGHLHDFCSSILPKQGEGILPTFAMWSTQTNQPSNKGMDKAGCRVAKHTTKHSSRFQGSWTRVIRKILKGIWKRLKEQQVTRGHNTVADGWAGASNSQPHLNSPTHT